MRLEDLIRAPTRARWTIRLVVYITFMVTISVGLQVLIAWWT